MNKKRIILIIIALLAVGFVFYVSVVYPVNVKKACQKAMYTFPKESQEQFYRNCVAESGVNPENK